MATTNEVPGDDCNIPGAAANVRVDDEMHDTVSSQGSSTPKHWMLQPLYPIFDGAFLIRIHPDRPHANIRVYDRNEWFLNIVYRYEVGHRSDTEIVDRFVADLLAHAPGWQDLPEESDWRMMIASMLQRADRETPLHRAAASSVVQSTPSQVDVFAAA